MSGDVGFRSGVVSLVVAAVVLLVTGCVPLKNAPPDGGEALTQTCRYGPFTFGPGQEIQGFPHPACRARPAPSA